MPFPFFRGRFRFFESKSRIDGWIPAAVFCFFFFFPLAALVDQRPYYVRRIHSSASVHFPPPPEGSSDLQSALWTETLCVRVCVCFATVPFARVKSFTFPIAAAASLRGLPRPPPAVPFLSSSCLRARLIGRGIGPHRDFWICSRLSFSLSLTLSVFFFA